jgi:hypothetical protein
LQAFSCSSLSAIKATRKDGLAGRAADWQIGGRETGIATGRAGAASGAVTTGEVAFAISSAQMDRKVLRSVIAESVGE